MAYIKSSIQPPSFVQVPTWFITDYMPKALSGYTKVYLYLLMQTLSSTEAICLEDTASQLDMLFSEVIQALKYWHDQKILIFKEGADDQFELQYLMHAPVITEQPDKPLPLTKTIIQQTRPNYRTEEITAYLEDKNVALLFKLAEQYLGRLLTVNDQKILYSFYDWLHMPFDLIEYLIEYCTSNNHRAMHYIEKVAINWVDEGIVTLEQAKAKTLSDKRYFKILSSLGSSKATLTPAEKKCMSKWLDTYHFSLEIVLEACRRTVMQTNKPSLNYVDSILTAWHQDKVKTMEDIAALDKAHESKKMQQTVPAGKTAALSHKIAKFNSMYTHDWDFDELEKLEEEHLSRELKGGN